MSTSGLWEVVFSILKHAGIVGLVAFLVALGQYLAGADWSQFGPVVSAVVIPALILVLSTVVKALQKGTEVALRKPDPPVGGDDGPGSLPFDRLA